jgi:hypothetical protein
MRAATALIGKTGLDAQSLNGLTAFVLQNYRVNQSHFVFSSIPFVLILAALPFLDRAIGRWDARFWFAFAATLLGFMLYFHAFIWALLHPLIHVGVAADHEATMVTYVTGALVVLMVIALIRFRKESARRANR